MKPEQAFEQMKQQLKQELPKSFYDFRVAQMEFKSMDDIVMTVCFAEPLARDLVQRTLSTRIENLLTWIMNERTVIVAFEVKGRSNVDFTE